MPADRKGKQTFHPVQWKWWNKQVSRFDAIDRILIWKKNHLVTEAITKTNKGRKTNRADWAAVLLLWSPGFSPCCNSPITPNCPKQSPERPKLSLCLLNLLAQSLSCNDKWLSISKANSLMQLFNNNLNVSYSQLKCLVILGCKWICVCLATILAQLLGIHESTPFDRD